MPKEEVNIEIDLDEIKDIKNKRRDTKFINIYPDSIVFEVYELREKHTLSILEIIGFMKKKYNITVSTAFVSRIEVSFKKRFPKQKILKGLSENSAQYPFYSKRPTKVPKKKEFYP